MELNNENIFITKIIERREPIKKETVIPKLIIQTYKTNELHPFIYNNIMKMLEKNKEYEYRFITDEDGIELLKHHFDENILDAFLKVKLNAAKGDFIRYIALYIYGGIYLDLDASIEIDLNDFFFGMSEKLDDKDFIFFYNEHCDAKIEQWLIMVKPNNEIILKVIEEMVKRINNGEKNIFIATGPTLFTDVIYNLLNNTKIYNIKTKIDVNERIKILQSLNNNKNEYTNHGIFYNRQNLKKYFKFRIDNYEDNIIYQDEEKYSRNDSIFIEKIMNEINMLNLIKEYYIELEEQIIKLNEIANILLNENKIEIEKNNEYKENIKIILNNYTNQKNIKYIIIKELLDDLNNDNKEVFNDLNNDNKELINKKILLNLHKLLQNNSIIEIIFNEIIINLNHIVNEFENYCNKIEKKELEIFKKIINNNHYKHYNLLLNINKNKINNLYKKYYHS